MHLIAFHICILGREMHTSPSQVPSISIRVHKWCTQNNMVAAYENEWKKYSVYGY